MLSRLRTRSADERGFTLIELLVVIAILGLLSAVVVFSVQGTGERGQRAAVQIDERILRTAEESHCARHGRYASGDELVAAGLLSAAPEIHRVEATGDPADDGLCGTVAGANHYRITCLDGSPMPDCGVAGVDPFDPEWFPASPLAEPAIFDLAVPLADGRILHVGRALVSSSPLLYRRTAQVYDPASDSWQTTGVPPLGTATAGILLRGSPLECGPHCGKVLVHLARAGSDAFALFDPVPGGWVSAGQSPYNRGYQAPGFLQLLPPGCGSHCGKVLVAGGWEQEGQFPMYPSARRSSELWDPRSNAFLPTAGQLNTDQKRIALARLDDGRVLALGNDHASQTEVYSPLTDQWAIFEHQSVTPRFNQEALVLRLPSSDILVLNRHDIEIYSQRARAWRGPYPCPNGRCNDFGRALAVMRDGKVMITGGISGGTPARDVALIFDPATGTFEDAPRQLSARAYGMLSSLPGGRVLHAGGTRAQTSSVPIDSVEIFGGRP